jgi:hypothetical protein
MIGVELVARSFPPAPRLGGALGIGFAGAGVRANLALRDPTANRRVPYVGVGYVALPWIPVLDVTSVTTLEAGVQLWPTGTRHIYADLGAGVGWLGGGAPSTGPVLRLLVGRVF